jgi:hypothetical protein
MPKMTISGIVKSKAFWLLVIAVFMGLFWLLGGVGAGLRMMKDKLAQEEIGIAEQLKTKLGAAEEKVKTLEVKNKVLETRATDLEKKMTVKDREIQAVKEEKIIVEEKLKNAEERLAAIAVPDTTGDRINQFRALGLRSATAIPEPIVPKP